MAKGDHNINEVGESVAVIVSELKNLSINFNEYKTENRKFCERITTKVNNTENEMIVNKTKVSNLAIFQSTLSIVIGAIATYLGTRK